MGQRGRFVPTYSAIFGYWKAIFAVLDKNKIQVPVPGLLSACQTPHFGLVETRVVQLGLSLTPWISSTWNFETAYVASVQPEYDQGMPSSVKQKRRKADLRMKQEYHPRSWGINLKDNLSLRGQIQLHLFPQRLWIRLLPLASSPYFAYYCPRPLSPKQRRCIGNPDAFGWDVFNQEHNVWVLHSYVRYWRDRKEAR